MEPDSEWVDVVVVGAGVSGIGAAWHLQHDLPDVSFAVLEGRDAIGGTWDLFRYPGVRSDSDPHTYAYPFKPWNESGPLASGDSILRYLDETLDEYGLRVHVRLGHHVHALSWSSDESCWTVDAERADGAAVRLRCSWVIATTGYYRYDRGHLPEFSGVERYRGLFVHAQDWPPGLDVEGQRVVVIGSGATAATLVPALADLGARVTMLQRSPSYYLSLPAHDPLAAVLQRHLSPRRSYAWMRKRNQAIQALFYRLCRRFPHFMRKILVRDVARRLPPGYDVGRHFTPRYDPWDQRVCVTPGGDLFATISAGGADVVTDTIVEFTESGIRLASGDEVAADVVVAATGLEVLALGDVQVDVDGTPMLPGDRLVYKSVMLSDVPNFAYVFGYANATWTLKVGLVCEWICRVIAHMRAIGATEVRVDGDPGPMPTRPMLDLAAGYVQRAADRLPQQGTGDWSVPVGYRADARRLRGPVDDGMLRYTTARSRSNAG